MRLASSFELLQTVPLSLADFLQLLCWKDYQVLSDQSLKPFEISHLELDLRTSLLPGLHNRELSANVFLVKKGKNNEMIKGWLDLFFKCLSAEGVFNRSTFLYLLTLQQKHKREILLLICTLGLDQFTPPIQSQVLTPWSCTPRNFHYFQKHA